MNTMDRNEARKEHRFDLEGIPTPYTECKIQNYERNSFAGSILNCSKSGICFMMPKEVEPTQVLTVHFIDRSGNKVELFVEVVQVTSSKLLTMPEMYLYHCQVCESFGTTENYVQFVGRLAEFKKTNKKITERIRIWLGFFIGDPIALSLKKAELFTFLILGEVILRVWKWMENLKYNRNNKK
jgi:hypothetical protein